MKKTGLMSIVFVVMLVALAECDELQSGLQLGDLATPFEVKDITGPNKGITLCYR